MSWTRPKSKCTYYLVSNTSYAKLSLVSTRGHQSQHGHMTKLRKQTRYLSNALNTYLRVHVLAINNKRNGFNPEWIKALDLGYVVISLQIYVVPTPTEAMFPVRSVYLIA